MSPQINGTSDTDKTPPVPGLWITGIGSQYPPYLVGPDALDKFAKRFYDVEKPGCVIWGSARCWEESC